MPNLKIVLLALIEFTIDVSYHRRTAHTLDRHRHRVGMCELDRHRHRVGMCWPLNFNVPLRTHSRLDLNLFRKTADTREWELFSGGATVHFTFYVLNLSNI